MIQITEINFLSKVQAIFLINDKIQNYFFY